MPNQRDDLIRFIINNGLNIKKYGHYNSYDSYDLNYADIIRNYLDHNIKRNISLHDIYLVFKKKFGKKKIVGIFHIDEDSCDKIYLETKTKINVLDKIKSFVCASEMVVFSLSLNIIVTAAIYIKQLNNIITTNAAGMVLLLIVFLFTSILISQITNNYTKSIKKIKILNYRNIYMKYIFYRELLVVIFANILPLTTYSL